MKNFIYLIFISLLVILACSSPKKSLEKGQYKKAFSSALTQLKKHKDYETNQVVLVQSFKRIFESSMQIYWDLEAKDDPVSWSKALKTSKSIQTKISKIIPYSDVSYDASLDTLHKYDEQLKDRYTFYFEEKGKDALALYEDNHLKKNAQNAVRAFNQADRYRVLSVEIDSLRSYALSNATVYYNIDVDGIMDVFMSNQAEEVFGRATGFSSDFLEVSVSPFGMWADCDISVQFGFLNERNNETSTTQSFDKQIQDGFETSTDTSGVMISTPIYKTITGSVEQVTFTKTMDWSINVNVWSKTNDCNLSNHSFGSSITASVQNNELSGDERAIPLSYKNQIKNEINEEDMTDELIEDLYEQFVRYYF